MTEVQIRDIVDTDLAEVLRINEANVPEVGPLDIASLRRLVDQCRYSLVIERAGSNGGDTLAEVMGFCLVLTPGAAYDSVNYGWFAAHHPAAMYLDRVAFDAGFQGAGHGRALYEHIERRIRSDAPDATGLGLEVNVDPPNEPSLRFHDKLGFSEVGRQMSHGIEVSLMFKPAAAFAAG